MLVHLRAQLATTATVVEHLYCDRELCDYANRIKDFTLDWSSLETAFKFVVAIPDDTLPTSHDNSSYSLTETVLEWEY